MRGNGGSGAVLQRCQVEDLIVVKGIQCAKVADVFEIHHTVFTLVKSDRRAHQRCVSLDLPDAFRCSTDDFSKVGKRKSIEGGRESQAWMHQMRKVSKQVNMKRKCGGLRGYKLV